MEQKIRKRKPLKLGRSKQKDQIWALKRARRSAIRAAKKIVGGRLSIDQVKAALAGL
jgi:hypothetical protein